MNGPTKRYQLNQTHIYHYLWRLIHILPKFEKEILPRTVLTPSSGY